MNSWPNSSVGLSVWTEVSGRGRSFISHSGQRSIFWLIAKFYPEKCSLDEKYLVRSEIKTDLKIIGKSIARNGFVGHMKRISYDP